MLCLWRNILIAVTETRGRAKARERTLLDGEEGGARGVEHGDTAAASVAGDVQDVLSLLEMEALRTVLLKPVTNAVRNISTNVRFLSFDMCRAHRKLKLPSDVLHHRLATCSYLAGYCQGD